MVDAGPERAESAAAAASRSDFVFFVVIDDAQVREAFSGTDGVIEGARPGTIVGICASVSPATCHEVAKLGDEREIHVVDIALVGGERGAEEGRMTLLCGGRDDVVGQGAPAFAPYATNVCVIGPIGAGQVAMAADNILMWTAIRIDVEALRLARACGVEPGKLRPALMVGTGANKVLDEWGRHRLRCPATDLEVAQQMAADVSVEVPMVSTLADLMSELSVDDLRDLR